MRIISKPWGQENIFADTTKYCGKILIIQPGHCLSRQFHKYKEETFMVLKGVLTLEIGESPNINTLLLKENQTFHCPPNTIHRMICDKDKNDAPVEVVEVSTNFPNDVVRLEDNYKR